MKSWKKPLLIAVCALAATAALALPASASAAVWQHEGKELKSKVEFSLTGGEVIEVSGAVLLCETTATMTTEGGSTAKITAYDVKEATCVGLAGKLEGCEVTTATPKNLSWGVSVTTGDLSAKEVAMAYTFDKACEIQKIETSFPSLTLTPESPEAIRFFHFGQETKAQVDSKETALTYSGSLNLPEKDFDTYGIG
jgi:hypothetical protein